jgi:hypothetical protein
MATHNQATCGERRNVGRGWRVGAFPVWAFGFGHIAAHAVLAGWNVRRVEIPWVRWCSECATAEHPFKPVRTSFHTVCLGM